MHTPKLALLTPAILGLTIASGGAAAGDCVGAKAYEAYLQAHRHVASYGHAIATIPSHHYSAQTLRVAHHMDAGGHSEAAPARKDIVELAASTRHFDTLVSAINAAGLADTLQGEGPFTVFAPTNEAFAKLPKEQLSALLSDKEALVEVLSYHVVPGKVTSTEVVKLSSAKTVQGQDILIGTDSDGVTVNDARVVKADIEADNGVIHVIDTVILPK